MTLLVAVLFVLKWLVRDFRDIIQPFDGHQSWSKHVYIARRPVMVSFEVTLVLQCLTSWFHRCPAVLCGDALQCNEYVSSSSLCLTTMRFSYWICWIDVLKAAEKVNLNREAADRTTNRQLCRVIAFLVVALLWLVWFIRWKSAEQCPDDRGTDD